MFNLPQLCLDHHLQDTDFIPVVFSRQDQYLELLIQIAYSVVIDRLEVHFFAELTVTVEPASSIDTIDVAGEPKPTNTGATIVEPKW